MFSINQAFSFDDDNTHVTYVQIHTGMWFLNDGFDDSWYSIGTDAMEWHAENAPLNTLPNLHLFLENQELKNVEHAINKYFFH